MDSGDWDKWQRDWAIPIGVALNVVFFMARANVGFRKSNVDEVFGDDYGTTGWLAWPVCWQISPDLIALS